MNKLFKSANLYLKKSTWKDLALIKFCLLSVGIILGVCVPSKYKKPAVVAAAIVFVATYIPIMKKYIGILLRKKI